MDVGLGDPGDGPLDEVYARIDGWEPADSLCVIAAQVGEVEQIVTTITGRGESRQVQRSARVMLAVQYRTPAERLTA